MDISNYTKATGNYLKAEDVKKNPTATFVITTEGLMQKSEKFGNERLHLEGQYAKEDKIFDCSKTNARFIQLALGLNTKQWIGRQLKLETYKTKTSDGKMVEAINVCGVI